MRLSTAPAIALVDCGYLVLAPGVDEHPEEAGCPAEVAEAGWSREDIEPSSRRG